MLFENNVIRTYYIIHMQIVGVYLALQRFSHIGSYLFVFNVIKINYEKFSFKNTLVVCYKQKHWVITHYIDI